MTLRQGGFAWGAWVVGMVFLALFTAMALAVSHFLWAGGIRHLWSSIRHHGWIWGAGVVALIALTARPRLVAA